MSVEQTVAVGSTVGLHARPASAVVKAAGALPAVVYISLNGGTPVDCRSMLSLLALGAGFGDEVLLTSEGEGAEESVAAMAELIATDLDA